MSKVIPLQFTRYKKKEKKKKNIGILVIKKTRSSRYSNKKIFKDSRFIFFPTIPDKIELGHTAKRRQPLTHRHYIPHELAGRGFDYVNQDVTERRNNLSYVMRQQRGRVKILSNGSVEWLHGYVRVLARSVTSRIRVTITVENIDRSTRVWSACMGM